METLMTVQEFNIAVTEWALRVKRAAKMSLANNTHSSGALASRLIQYVDKLSSDEPAYKVKFQFDRYGVFRAYGAGRGYVVLNGKVVRGYRLRSLHDMKERRFSVMAERYRNGGFSASQLKRMKLFDMDNEVIRRSPLNWIDMHVDESIDTLAEAVQEYYGDDAVKSIADRLSNIRIVK